MNKSNAQNAALHGAAFLKKSRHRPFKSLLLVSVFMPPFFSLSAQETLPQDGMGITRMIWRAEVSGLRDAANRESPEQDLARAAYYRVIANIEESNRWAKKCIGDERVNAQPGQGILFLCRSVLAGNSLTLGDRQSWAKEMLEVRQIFETNIRPRLPDGMKVSAIEFPNFQSVLDREYKEVLTVDHGGYSSLKLEFKAGLPIVTATLLDGADGKGRNISVEFVVDTGSSGSFLNRRFVDAIGLKVTENAGVNVSNALGNEQVVSFDLVDPVDIKLGNSLVRNLSFYTGDAFELNIIGMDVIRILGTVNFNGDKFEIFSDRFAAPCEQSFLISSTPWATYWQHVLPMNVNGNNLPLVLDTGLTAYLESSGTKLEGTSQSSIQERSYASMWGVQRVKYVERELAVKIGSLVDTVPVIETDRPGQVYPISWRIGAHVLKDYGLRMDVSSGKACFHKLS